MDNDPIVIAVRTVVREELAPVHVRLDGIDQRLDAMAGEMKRRFDWMDRRFNDLGGQFVSLVKVVNDHFDRDSSAAR